MKEDKDLGIVIIAVYVDDCYAIGHEPALNDMINKIQEQGLKIKVEDEMSDYLSAKYYSTKTYQSLAWTTPSGKRLEQSFKEFIKSTKQYTFKTPGTPGMNIVRPKNDDEKISPDEQSMYRSAVGTLLHS